jgi:hypothetical protein
VGAPGRSISVIVVMLSPIFRDSVYTRSPIQVWVTPIVIASDVMAISFWVELIVLETLLGILPAPKATPSALLFALVNAEIVTGAAVAVPASAKETAAAARTGLRDDCIV